MTRDSAPQTPQKMAAAVRIRQHVHLWSAVHLTQLFDESLSGRARSPGLDYVDAGGTVRTLTFGEIETRANRMAQVLRARGLERGDRLCVHLPNQVEFIDLFLACVRLGVIMVPINILYKEGELTHIVADSEPKAIVGAAEYPAGVPVWSVAELMGAAAGHERRLVANLPGDAPAVIIYTSGTTGKAKGAVLSHDNLAANGRTLAAAWRITAADRYLAVLPLFHVHGLGNGVHTWLISGCRMRLEERFDHRKAAAVFAEFKPTVFFGVPTVYVRLLDTDVISAANARDIGNGVRLFVSGSAPLSEKTFADFEYRFGHRILERYGMSEALMIAGNPYDGERRPGTVGPALPGVSVRLAGDDGEEVRDDVRVGEVQVKSPALFNGYWRNPEATKAAFTRDGWFKTGDIGQRAADGYYTLVNRKSELIISGGFNIYPREIEEMLTASGFAREAAVVGAPDKIRGEVPIAYVVGAKVSNDELVTWCKLQLASFKTPRAFIRVDALPRNAMGKVQKHLLPEWKG